MEIVKASDVSKGKDFSALIYAQPGSGKTTTAKYLSGKTLVIDVDRTTNVLAGLDNIDIVYLDTIHPALKTKELLKDIHDNYLDKYDNVFFDNLSEFEQSWFGEKANESKTKAGKDMGTPQQGDYNQYTYYLHDMIQYINSWKNINKIYTAWEGNREIISPEGQSFTQLIPDIREKSVNKIMGLMNVVARLVINDETKKRGYLLAPTPAYYVKNQIDNRSFALQGDLFKWGDTDVQTPRLSNEASGSSKTKAK
ncbi:AAA family ATPase [Companilactobacillus insicii]|uniref:AAA family ATPase n=1 Tax=Companilactobacillus insicii TaxID=1732567 RepID=UPI000F76D766|nr:AAA family ATPase [Companilactobacillus insicii]